MDVGTGQDDTGIAEALEQHCELQEDDEKRRPEGDQEASRVLLYWRETPP